MFLILLFIDFERKNFVNARFKQEIMVNNKLVKR